MKWETIWILDGEFVSPSGRAIELPYFSAEFLLCSFQILHRFRLKTSTAKFRFVGLLAYVNVLIRSVSPEVDATLLFLGNMHAEIEQKFSCLLHVWMTIGLHISSAAWRQLPYARSFLT